MRKLVKLVLCAVVISISPVSTLSAEANPINQQLEQIIADKGFLRQVNDFIQLRDQLNKLTKDELMRSVITSGINQQEAKIIYEAVNNKENINEVIQKNVRDAVQSEVNKRIGKYAEQMNLLSKLLDNNLLSPQVVKNNDSLIGAPHNYSKILNMTATAYAPGPLDNGKWNNLTYMGGIVRKGVAAVDPAVIPMGSKLWIEGYGYAIAEDQGSAIKGNRIDLAFDTRQEALDYGIQPVKVYILNQ